VTAVEIASEDVVLGGEAWAPDRDVVAGVVMIGGSGPADRTNGGYFDAYREAFVSRGVAGLSYDKRGVGQSTGSYLAGTLEDLATDAVAAFDHLAQALGPRVPVGLFGHSEGGWVALRAAARNDGVAFVVTNSCPGMTPGEQDRHAIVGAMRGEDISQPEQANVLNLYDDLMRAAAADSAYAAVKETVELSAARPQLEHYLGEIGPTMWAFWKRKSAHDPLRDHEALTCPHLAVYGAADPMVPVRESVVAYTSSACSTTRSAAATLTVHVVPAADHRILCPGQRTPGARHLDRLASWISGAAAGQ
jgi:pimeloyl-ACP methyl ester carboxylesterase